MRVVIVGGTGETGQHAVKQCLDLDHHVTAVVRSTAKLTMKHPHLNVVTGDIFNAESLAPHFKNQEAVLYCLGFGSPYKGTTLYNDSIKPIVEAMKSASINRLITCSSWFTNTESNSRSMNVLIRWVIMPALQGMVDDIARMEKYVVEDGEINYTFVKPSRLVNEAMVEEEKILSEEGDFIPSNAWVPKIPRANVAKFMIHCLTDSKWDKKNVAIAVKSM